MEPIKCDDEIQKIFCTHITQWRSDFYIFDYAHDDFYQNYTKNALQIKVSIDGVKHKNIHTFEYIQTDQLQLIS